MTRAATLVIALLFVAVTPGAVANHCATETNATPVGVLYVYDGEYIYMESNGQAGLQRGSANSAVGKALGVPGDNGTCSHPDSILF